MHAAWLLHIMQNACWLRICVKQDSCARILNKCVLHTFIEYTCILHLSCTALFMCAAHIYLHTCILHLLCIYVKLYTLFNKCALHAFTLNTCILHLLCIYVTVFGKTNRLARKTKFFFTALLPFTSSEDAAVQI